MGNNNFNEKTKIQYYNLLQKTIKQIYDKNRYSKFNKGYSLLINKFAARRQSTKIFLDQQYENVDWKLYLLENLEPSPNDELWKKNLYNFVMKGNFPNQYMYQNSIFFEEFSLLTNPKHTLKKGNIHSLSTEPVLSSLDSRELKSLSRTIYSLGINTSSSEEDLTINENDNNLDINNNLDQHITMNITMESITPSMIDKDPKYETELNSLQIKKYIQIIKKQLANEDHPISLIINQFVIEFKPYLNSIATECEKNKEEKSECFKIGKRAISQIQNFIEIMQVVLKLFYAKSINYRNFVDEKDEIINLISYIFFSKKIIYRNVSKILSYMNYEKILRLEKQFKKFGELTPKEIGVNPKFCLDQVTEEYMREYKEDKNNAKYRTKARNKCKIIDYLESENYSNDSNSNIDNNKEDIMSIKTEGNNTKSRNNNIYIDDENISSYKLKDFKDTLDSYQDDMDIKELLLNNIENEGYPSLPLKPEKKNIFLSKIPYLDAINYLKQIDTYRAPLEKLIVIALISVIITDCVDKYWESLKKDLPGKFLNIDADELMSIYLYIIYKLKRPELFVQLDFIKYFTTNQTKQSMIGYYYTALEGCLNFILSLEDKSSLLRDKQ